MSSALAPAGRSRLGGRVLAPLAILAAAGAPYLGVLDAPFVFDDVKLVRDNALLREGWSDLWKVLETFDVTSRRWDEEDLRPNYRPLRFLSYLLDYQLTRACFGEPPPEGPRPTFFHLTNVLLHGLNALLVAAIARRLAGTLLAPPAPGEEAGAARTARFFSLAAGLLFALHPLATEAVTYVSGRRDVLSATFFLAALAAYLRGGPREAPRASTVALVPVLLAAALLSKEAAVTLPPLLLLVDVLRRAAWCPRRVLVHALSWGVALAVVAVTLSNPRLIAAPPAEGPVATALTAARYAARYLGLALLPLSQSVDYSFDAIPPSSGLLEPWTTLPSFVLVLGLAAAGTTALRRAARGEARGGAGRAGAAAFALGSLWFLGTLVPVLQVVPIPERFAERFAYLPLAGAVLAAAWLLSRLFRFELVLGAGAAGVLGVAALAATVSRNADWRSPIDLWTAAVRAQPRAARAHLGRANALKELGMASRSEGTLREAAEEYTRALEIFEERPGVPLHHGFILQALALRGGVFAVLGASDPAFLDRAVEDHRRVLSMRDTDGTEIATSPRHTALRFDLAGVLLRKGLRAEARLEYERVLELGTPAGLVGAAQYYLGKIALLDGDPRTAADRLAGAYEAIPRGDPSKLPVAVELADALIDAKDLGGAERAVELALAEGASGTLRHTLLTRKAKALDRRGDLEGCVAVLRGILEEDAAYAPALLSLAGIDAGRGEHAAAEELYRVVLERDPANAEALQGLQSVRLLRKIAQEKGSQALPAVGEAEVLATLERRCEEALARGEVLAARELHLSLLTRATAAKAKASQLRALRGLASIEERLGHGKKSEEHLRTALELEPGDPETLRALADLAFGRGEREAARVRYERYLEALPAGARAAPEARLRLAQAIGKADPNRALEQLRLAREAGSEDPAIDREAGYLHAEAGRWKESLDAFVRYLERTPALDGSGREDAARRAAKDFVKEHVLPHVEG